MKRLILQFAVVIVFASSVVAFPVDAQEARYASCDGCGFCITKCDATGEICQDSQFPQDWPQQQGGWASCQQCIYPEAYPLNPQVTPDAREGYTLLIDEETNLAPTPYPGRHSTVFGCIKTDIGDFTQTGAARSLVQVLLNIIFTTAGGVAILYIIYGSFLLLTSQADPERVAYGRRVVMGAIIGLIFVFCSVLIVNLLANGVLQLPGFGNNGAPPTP